MSSQDKLPLLKSAIKMLSDTLTSQDKVSIVVYAGEAGVVLDGINGADSESLDAALAELKAAGAPTAVKASKQLTVWPASTLSVAG